MKLSTTRVVAFALACALAKAQEVIDLEKPLPVAPHHNDNPGARALLDAKSFDIFGYAVLKGGELVASWGPTAKGNVWSVTKTWVATLIGILIQKGILASTSATLENALPTVDWSSVPQGEQRKRITIRQVLSMSSGLQANCMWYGDQSTAAKTVGSPPFNPSAAGTFWYLCSGSILSYVVRELTGKTPLAFANEELFPALGISRAVEWDPKHGVDRVEEGGHGLILYPNELAKLAQLYIQRGVAGPSGKQIIPAQFADASRTSALSHRISASELAYLGPSYRCTFKANGAGYGYMTWLFDTNAGPANCAVGHQGQFICTWPDIDVSISITSSTGTDYSSSCKLLDVIASGDVSFAAPPPTGIPTTPQPTKVPMTKMPTTKMPTTAKPTFSGSDDKMSSATTLRPFIFACSLFYLINTIFFV